MCMPGDLPGGPIIIKARSNGALLLHNTQKRDLLYIFLLHLGEFPMRDCAPKHDLHSLPYPGKHTVPGASLLLLLVQLFPELYICLSQVWRAMELEGFKPWEGN